MIHVWNRGIPALLGWALIAAAIGPNRHSLDMWVISGAAVGYIYLVYASLLLLISVAPMRFVRLHLPGAALAFFTGAGALAGSLHQTLPTGDFWLISGGVTGTLFIFGILFVWHWLMVRFWPVLLGKVSKL